MAQSKEAPSPETWRGEPVLCLDRLRRASGGDDAFVRVLLDTYFATVPTRLRLIRSALRKSDLDAVRYQAHAAGDSSHAIGAARMAGMFGVLEKEPALEAARLVAAQLPKELRAFAAIVRKVGFYPPKA